MDTGFTGFVLIPLVQAFPLGLILEGTTSVVLADGSTSINLVARGQVDVEGEKRIGTVLLDAGAADVLLGMDFLRHFKRILYISSSGIILADENELETRSELNPVDPTGTAPPDASRPPLRPPTLSGIGHLPEKDP